MRPRLLPALALLGAGVVLARRFSRRAPARPGTAPEHTDTGGFHPINGVDMNAAPGQ